MITRRRGRMSQSSEQHPVEVEVSGDLPSPSEPFPGHDLDVEGMELDELFDIDEFKWTLDRDHSSPLFDLEELGVYCGKEDEDNMEGSSASSPERSGSKRIRQPGRVINKNAIAARLNRLKKKEYVTNLEKKVSGLSIENTSLKQENSELSKRVEELEDETRYLRAVLANDSMLAQLLTRLGGVNGMKLSSSLLQGPDPNEHDYALPRKRVKVQEKETGGGVCLHVDKNHVSVEFCTKCAERANTAIKM